MKSTIAILLVICISHFGYSQESVESVRNSLASGKIWKLHKIVSDNDTTSFSCNVFLKFNSVEQGNKKEFTTSTGGAKKEAELNFKYKIEEKDDEFVLRLDNLNYLKGTSELGNPKFNDLKRYKIRFIERDSRDFLRLTKSSTSGNKPSVHYYFSN